MADQKITDFQDREDGDTWRTQEANQFRVFLADTPEAREIHHALRYAVFCEDRAYEDSRAFPNSLEVDHYDDRSAHFVVQEVTTGRWVAAARLILPSDDPLQVEKYCQFRSEKVHPTPKRVAEVSRLAIPRRSGGVVTTRSPLMNMSSRRNADAGRSSTQQHVILASLLRGLATYGCENGITHAVFFTTRSLARILGRIGVDLRQVGDAVVHRGVRHPYLVGGYQAIDALEAWARQSLLAYTPFSRIRDRGLRSLQVHGSPAARASEDPKMIKTPTTTEKG